jgi:nucleoside-diphosphate-sugar epimerase
MGTLLLTGGTGFLGSWILAALGARGTARRLGIDTVRMLVRNPAKAAGLGLHVEGVRVELRAGDLRDHASLRSAASGADAVMHVAALYDMSSSWKDFYQSNVVATEALIQAIRPGGRLVLTSTYGVYGFPSSPEPIRESYEPKRPIWHYQKTKKMQEDLARELCRGKGIRFVALRPPTIIGARETLSVPTLVDTILGNRMILVGDGSNRLPLAHGADAAQAHLLALERIDAVDGAAFHFAGFQTTFREYIDAFCRALGVPPVRRRVPVAVARAVGAAGDALRLLGIRSPYTGFSVAYGAADDVLDDSAIRDRLGFKPEWDIERTVADCVSWYREAKPKAR